jgi:acyl-CoA synthetase (AMP-forming)/AMP-acid ligase II
MLRASTLRSPSLPEHLAHFKVPKFFHFTNHFPVTVTGKVRKVELRDMAKKLLGLQNAA